ncbi:peptide/nickel transport system ATP-binding protein/oligopeptide transport system ATP-binding protein [Azorhizobium sp. AG788]|uniref:ABC transporter ATP-binding protein n=1 Tax=Azorhizobium sp. AG788 TaxID=2183897 RepID=UPI00105F18AD|nr:oligopeptide/dipeptide ABC transporter ATP-binding protein [Azorhizobium sp. AG788]TDT93497.1 peptide/nickel transport system ATP-binding protein/oligopeptide transport system ATP-binding protein [Azorhizobium sp. AG788]
MTIHVPAPANEPIPFPPRGPLLRAERLERAFKGRGLFGGAPVLALRGVDFVLGRGEAVGVVGESGCGKSTLARVLLHLTPPSAGRVLFDGKDLAKLPARELRALRRRMQLVFQDPFASLDPRRTIGDQIADGILIHGLASAEEAREKVAGLLAQVGLDPAHGGRLPHEFSGGQRQRIAIARALSTSPDVLVADEPVSALDVSVQAQVVNLLKDLRSRLGLGLIFISHDLHVVRHLCDRVVVMYLGRVVEEASAADLFANPKHPYTQALLAATPSMHAPAGRRPTLAGEMPSPANPPSGCAFRTRCPRALPSCAEEVPPLVSIGRGRAVACPPALTEEVSHA